MNTVPQRLDETGAEVGGWGGRGVTYYTYNTCMDTKWLVWTIAITPLHPHPASSIS